LERLAKIHESKRWLRRNGIGRRFEFVLGLEVLQSALGETKGSTSVVETISSTHQVGRHGLDGGPSVPLVNGVGVTARNDKDPTAMTDTKDPSHLSTAMPSVPQHPPQF
jgi:hypothetical protein